MSDYLVNLARRSAGIAPVARPRPAPGPGPMAGSVRGVERASPASSSGHSGSAAGTDTSAASGNLRSIRVTTSPDDEARAPEVSPLAPTVDSATWGDERRPLRIAERGAAAERIGDPQTAAVSPRQPALSGAEPSSSVPSLSAIADHASGVPSDPGSAHDRPALEPRGDDLTVELPFPRVSTNVRRTDIPWMAPTEPVLAPAPLGAPRAVIEGGPGREVHVRIGTIEIHAESETSAPASLPAAVAPTVPVASPGGFDDFVRLRSYAPWER